MTTVFEHAAAALDTLTPVPYALGQYLTENGADLPDTFLVYTLVVDDAQQHMDDAETERSYTVQVSIYARDGLVSLPDVDAAMRTQDFAKGPERQLPYDDETRHFGLACDYTILLNTPAP